MAFSNTALMQDLFSNTDTTFNLHNYDHYIIAFSGGKDCTACFLWLLEQGIPVSKMELWHHDIDGRGDNLMDWEVTPAYCRAFADAFHVPIYFSWKQGGFKREMLRDNAPTAPISFECPDGILRTAGGDSGKCSTRLRFPQVAADLSVRWCSSYLKIDVGVRALVNQKRFNGKRTLFISGERGEESAAREKYNVLEEDKADNRYKGYYYADVNRNVKGKSKTVRRKVIVGKSDRLIDRYRPVLRWTESQVWAIIEKYRVRVHPCYYLGYSRCSCKFCIFGNADQFATSYSLSPEQGKELIALEKQFGVTMKRNSGLPDFIASGRNFAEPRSDIARIATSTNYTLAVILPENENWILPSGAYKGGCSAR